MAAIAVLLLNVAAFSAGDTRSAKAKKREAARLVSLLPASDGVAVFEARRFLNEALPKVLSANQPMLNEIMAKITEMETRTGIDLRKFDQVAAGVAMKQISPTNVDWEPVAVASGDINAGALIAVAKLASKGSYREEMIGDKTVYVFTVKDVAAKTSAAPAGSKVAGAIDDALKGISREIAVTTLDRNTLVIGSVRRVRETLAGTTHVIAEVGSLLSYKESAIMSFAAKVPTGTSTMLPENFDSVDKSIDSIRYVYGSVDVSAAGTSIKAAARTQTVEQAVALKDMMDVLQVMGGGMLSGSTKPAQQIYGRILKDIKIAANGTDVTLDLLVPQTDIDLMVAGIK